MASTGLSAGFFFRLNMPPGPAGDGAEPSAAASCVSWGSAGSSERISVTSFEPEFALFSVTRAAVSVRESDAALSITKRDRKSTRLNSSHGYISYAVFCLKKKKKKSLLVALSHHRSVLDV